MMGQIEAGCSEGIVLSNPLKKRIVDLLKNNSRGLTIADISKRVSTSRHTASIILAELRGAKLIDIRKVGMAKLHNWRDEEQ